MQEIIQFGFLEHKYMQTRNKTRNAVIFTLNKEYTKIRRSGMQKIEI